MGGLDALTAIIAALAWRRAFQVSDRLVTKAASTHDAAANKSLVVRGRDGYFFAGYSGVAYIGDRPTDDFLAAAIMDLDDAPRGMAFRSGFGSATLFGLVSRIRERLGADYPHSQRRDLYIDLVGAQLRRGRWQPLHWHISNVNPDREFRFQALKPRSVNWARSFATSPIGMVPIEVFEAMRATLKQTTSPDSRRDVEAGRARLRGAKSDPRR